MLHFKKILVSLDFSESAASALKVAVSLAAALGAELHLTTVVQLPLQLAVGGPVPSTGDLDRDVRKRAENRLNEAADRAVEGGVATTVHVLEGEVPAAIVALAESLSIDLIVVGRRGVTRLAEAMLGSVADRVVRLAPCPVMIVRAADGITE